MDSYLVLSPCHCTTTSSRFNSELMMMRVCLPRRRRCVEKKHHITCRWPWPLTKAVDRDRRTCGTTCSWTRYNSMNSTTSMHQIKSSCHIEWHREWLVPRAASPVTKSPHRTNKLDANLAIVVQLLNVVLDVPNIFCKINTTSIRESDVTHLKSVSYSIIRVPRCIFRRKFLTRHLPTGANKYMVANARSADRI